MRPLNKLRIWSSLLFILTLVLIIQPYQFLYLISSYRWDHYQYSAFKITTALFIILIVGMIGLIFTWKQLRPVVVTIVLIPIYFIGLLFHHVGGITLPSDPLLVKAAPNKLYQATLYTVGCIDIIPKIVIEGRGRIAKVIYIGRQGTLAKFNWIDNTHLEVVATCADCKITQSGPFVLDTTKDEKL